MLYRDLYMYLLLHVKLSLQVSQSVPSFIMRHARPTDAKRGDFQDISRSVN